METQISGLSSQLEGIQGSLFQLLMRAQSPRGMDAPALQPEPKQGKYQPIDGVLINLQRRQARPAVPPHLSTSLSTSAAQSPHSPTPLPSQVTRTPRGGSPMRICRLSRAL
jgi:hypothetical protein